MMNRCFHFALS